MYLKISKNVNWDVIQFSKVVMTDGSIGCNSRCQKYENSLVSNYAMFIEITRFWVL